VNNQALKAFHLVFLGVSAVCAQAIFTRELMTLFSGTEFVIGLILAAWLFWIGAGGILGGRIKRFRSVSDFSGFLVLSAVLSFLLPVTVLAIRFGRALMVNPPGSLPPLGKAAVFSIIIQAPFCFVYGHLYNVTSNIWLKPSGSISSSVSRVYIFEALGSTAGAVLFSFILIPNVSQLLAAVAIGAALLVVVMSFPVSSKAVFFRRFLPAAGIAIALVVSLHDVDTWSMRGIFHGYSVEDVRFSRYGEIVLASHMEVLTVFSQGARLLSVPEPERAEEAVHIPMSIHPHPEVVLMVGGGIGGGVEEVMKYGSVKHLDCLEIDRKVLALRERINRRLYESMPESVATGLQREIREKVSFVHADGRFFLKRKPGKYDVIIVNAPPPLNLQLNRFYTVEFFREAKKSLKEGGVFAFTHQSSENFLSYEQAEIIGVLERTLKSVFENVLVLPGDIAHFLASDSELSKESILENLENRHINTRYINRNYLPFRFSDERVSFMKSAVGRAKGSRINTDSHPFVAVLEFLLEAKRTRFSGTSVFSNLLNMNPVIPFLVSIGVLFLIVALSRGDGLPRMGVWSVGFTSFILQILILLQFQSFSGLLYHAFIMLTAVFMVGASIGALIALTRRSYGKNNVARFHLAFAVFSLLLVGVSVLVAEVGVPYRVGFAVFMLLSLVSGLMTGAYYPLIVSIGFRGGRVKTPSEYYAWDLFGACLGGFLGGVFFFPLFGVMWTSLLLFLVNMFIYIVLPRKMVSV